MIMMSALKVMHEQIAVTPNYWDKDSIEPGGVFMCYRHIDIRAAVAIDEGLMARHFLPQAIFRADRSIRPGEQFREVLDRAVTGAQVILAIVGEGWSASFAAGKHTWAFRELQQAQERNIPILPVMLAQYYTHGNPIWQPDEQPLERLATHTLAPGIDPNLLSVEGVKFGLVDPARDIANIAAALIRIVPDLHQREH